MNKQTKLPLSFPHVSSGNPVSRHSSFLDARLTHSGMTGSSIGMTLPPLSFPHVSSGNPVSRYSSSMDSVLSRLGMPSAQSDGMTSRLAGMTFDPRGMTAALGNLPKVSFAHALRTFGRLSMLLYFILLPLLLFAQAPTVTGVTPAQNALNVPKDINITVTFSTDIDQSTISSSSIKINGSLSGSHTATYNYNSSTKSATITPIVPFNVGDVVTTTLTCGIKSTVGDSLIKSYTWSFSIKSDAGASGKFVQSSTPSVGSGPYSITAGDFNGDGSLDLAVANYYFQHRFHSLE